MRPDTTVFLVDDDPAVRDSQKLLLETYGFIVRDFASGSDFLSSGMRAEKGCRVLDMHMPVVSGLDLLERLAVQSTVPPTVIITGQADAGIRQRAPAAGAFQVIEKPFDTAALLKAMDAAQDGGARVEENEFHAALIR